MSSREKWTCFLLLTVLTITIAEASDPDQFLKWNVTYLDLAPLGGKSQRVIGINGMFPGPEIKTTTNVNLHIQVTNNLDEPLLFTWNGVQQRRTSWQDGVSGTNCPILPKKSWLYEFQAKDQIGTFFYFPSLLYQKAAGGYGGISIANRAVINVPFPTPAAEFTLLIGDWYRRDYKVARDMLNRGESIGRPTGVLINGKPPYFNSSSSTDYTRLTVESGKTYRLRISNVGTASSLNFRIQGHRMLLVETEGSYVNQTYYDSIDVHLGQSYSVLVQANQQPADYYIVASTKFSSRISNGVAVLHYQTSSRQASGSLPAGPDPTDTTFSISQARSIKWNLTSSGARPNPQGSYHYGSINVTARVVLASSSVLLNNSKQHYAVNGMSYLTPDTPLKLADYFNISGVFTLNSIPNSPPPSSTPPSFKTSVLSLDYRSFAEIVFINGEDEIQSWHIDGYNFFAVGYGSGNWSVSNRESYNLVDAVSRSTVQVYPNGWSAVLIAMDNVGMWNIRTQNLRRQYLGQELYVRIYNPENSVRTEAHIPENALLCGKASGKVIPPISVDELLFLLDEEDDI